MKTKERVVNKKDSRHGDLVNFYEGDFSSKKLKIVKDFVLAEGEHTGHKHVVRPLDEDTQISFTRELDSVIFKVENGRATLTHEEHDKIVYEPGLYIVRVQQEYDYFADEIRTVMD